MSFIMQTRLSSPRGSLCPIQHSASLYRSRSAVASKRPARHLWSTRVCSGPLRSILFRFLFLFGGQGVFVEPVGQAFQRLKRRFFLLEIRLELRHRF